MEQKENSQNFDEAKIDAEKEQTFLSRCPECESIKSLDINLLGKKIINESANDKTANTTSPADTAENNGNNSPENIYAKVINYFSVLKNSKIHLITYIAIIAFMIYSYKLSIFIFPVILIGILLLFRVRKNACNNKNKRESIILLFVLIACTSILYYLAPYIYCNKAAEAYNKGEYAQAVKWYRKAAERGDASAQNNLGLCYAYGDGVNKDYSEAVKWWRKAAEQGYAKAQNDLGLCYAYGDGVNKDYSEAVKWWRKAAEQGHEKARKNLENLAN